MATNLTPQQLAELQRLFSTPVQSSDVNANAYAPENVFYDGRTYDKRDAGYMAYDYDPNNMDDPRRDKQSLFNGQGFDEYGMDGTYTSSGQFTGIKDSNKLREFLIAGSMMLPGVAAGISPGINAALSFGTNPVMTGGSALVGGPASAGWGMGLDSVTGGSGAAGVGGAVGTMAPLEQISTSLAEFGIPGEMATVGGSGLLNAAIKYGPAALGLLAGGAGGDGKGQNIREIDPRLLPYIFGDEKNKGAFGYAKGLLDAPVAPNGFERFYGAKK